MKISFTKRYKKQIAALKDQKLLTEVSDAVKNVIQANTTKDIASLKKMKGYKAYYRIRVGDYRIGIHIQGDTATFSYFAHRKDIYKTFP